MSSIRRFRNTSMIKLSPAKEMLKMSSSRLLNAMLRISPKVIKSKLEEC